MQSPHPHWRDMILNGELMDLDQAARYLAVSKGAIKIWEARGYLSRVNKGETPALYMRTALDDCEQKRHDNRKHRRRSLKPTAS